MCKWLDIETAPKKKPILLWNERARQQVIAVLGEEDTPSYCRAVGENYWMPLPPPPKGAA